MADFDKNDWNHFHDVVMESNGGNRSKKELEIIYESLPEDLKELAEEYGMNDTCFRDNTITYLREQNELQTNTK